MPFSYLGNIIDTSVFVLKSEFGIELEMPTDEFIVTGSPALWDGTFTVSLVDQEANTFFAGPVSGADAPPSFRELVAADISDLDDALDDWVSISLSMSSEFIVTGSPAEHDGGFTVTLEDQAANTVWAGPASGADAPPAFRLLTGDDISDLSTILADYLPLTGGTLTGPLHIEDGGTPLTVDGSIDITGDYLVNGVKLKIEPAGNDGEIQFKETVAGEAQLGASSRLAWDDANYRLEVDGNVGIGNDASQLPTLSTIIYERQLILGSTTAPNRGLITVCENNAAGAGRAVGALAFANYANPNPDKRIVQISGYTGSTLDTGRIAFHAWKNGASFMTMQITQDGNVGIGNDASVLPSSPTGTANTDLIVGLTTPGNHRGRITMCGNTTTVTSVGHLVWANYAISAPDKRLGIINCYVTTPPDSGTMTLGVANAGQIITAIQIASNGNVGMGNDASVTGVNPTILGAHLIVGSNVLDAGGTSEASGRITLARNTTATNAYCGFLGFANFAKVNNPNEYRLAYLAARTDAANYEVGHLVFHTNSGTSCSEKVRITGSGNIGVWNDGTMISNAPGYPQVTIGSPNLGGGYGFVAVGGNRVNVSDAVGGYAFFNFANTGVDKRVGQITGMLGNSINSGHMVFYTYNSGSSGERMRITQDGTLAIGNDGAINPTSLTRPQLLVGRSTDSTASLIVCCTNTIAGNATVGSYAFVNYNIADVDKRTAYIWGMTGPNPSSGSIGFVTRNSGGTPTERMRITYDGNVLVWGAIQGQGDLSLSGSGSVFINAEGIVINGNQGFAFYGGNDCSLTGGRLLFSATQNVLVNRTVADSTGAKLQVNGGISNNGAIVSAVSDARLKRDIEPFKPGLETVLQVKPIKFRYNGKGGTVDGSEWVSIDAEAHKDVIPEAINKYKGELDGKETDLYNFSLQPLVMMLINAVQQIDSRLQKLEENK